MAFWRASGTLTSYTVDTFLTSQRGWKTIRRGTDDGMSRTSCTSLILFSLDTLDEDLAQNEDDRERMEMDRMQRRMEHTETFEQKSYREEFFELLDEVHVQFNCN